MRNEYPWIPGGHETFSAVAPPRPVVADPTFPSTGAPASDTLTCGHGAQTRPITASELAACWPGSLRRRSMHAAAAADAAARSPRRSREERLYVVEQEVILSPSTGVCYSPTIVYRVALWNASHRSRVNSGQRFNRGFDREPPLNADG